MLMLFWVNLNQKLLLILYLDLICLIWLSTYNWDHFVFRFLHVKGTKADCLPDPAEATGQTTVTYMRFTTSPLEWLEHHGGRSHRCDFILRSSQQSTKCLIYAFIFNHGLSCIYTANITNVQCKTWNNDILLMTLCYKFQVCLSVNKCSNFTLRCRTIFQVKVFSQRNLMVWLTKFLPFDRNSPST